MSMEQWWIDILWGKLKKLVGKPGQVIFSVPRISHEGTQWRTCDL